MPVRTPADLLASIAAVPRSAKAAVLVAAMALGGATLAIGQTAPPAAPSASSLTAQQRKEIESIIKDYLVNNPEVLLEAQNALEAKMDKIQAERMAAALKDHAGELFKPVNSPVVNAKGEVPVIEFFDYNCGYCKKALGEVTKMMDKDKSVRLILKEFPILSKGSEEASKVALAAKMQGKYWEFHRAMLANQGQANEASALRVAEKVGLDVARLKKDMDSPEVKKEIDDTRELASKMGIQGTPHFIVGDKIIPGAPENLLELLGKHAADVRKEGCKVC